MDGASGQSHFRIFLANAVRDGVSAGTRAFIPPFLMAKSGFEGTQLD
jgi:hypothetical protein